MRKRLILLAILAVGGAVPAAACNCPKEQLIKEHGTVGVFDTRRQPGPVRAVVAPVVPKVQTQNGLPLLVPVRQATMAGSTSLEWLLLEP
jgi:hypothetical protein